MIIKLIKRKVFENFLHNLTLSKIDTLSGIEFENFIYSFFEYLGYSCSLTATTGDNGIDIIAENGHVQIGIQTKLYYNHSVGNKAVQEAYSGKDYYKLTHAMVVTNWTLSKPALTLAQDLGVIVIDRSELINILNMPRREIIKLIKNKLIITGRN